MLNKDNPWINVLWKTWQDTVKLYGLLQLNFYGDSELVLNRFYDSFKNGSQKVSLFIVYLLIRGHFRV